MEKIDRIHPNDVLCGRHSSRNKHVGNARWRELVNSCKKLYLSVPVWQQTNVSASIVRAVRSQRPPGRFLEKDDKSGTYFDIGDLLAADKTSEALEEDANDSKAGGGGSKPEDEEGVGDGTGDSMFGERGKGQASMKSGERYDETLKVASHHLPTEKKEDRNAMEGKTHVDYVQAQTRHDGQGNNGRVPSNKGGNNPFGITKTKSPLHNERQMMPTHLTNSLQNQLSDKTNNNDGKQGSRSGIAAYLTSSENSEMLNAAAAAYLLGRNHAGGPTFGSSGGEKESSVGHQINSSAPLLAGQQNAAALAAASAMMHNPSGTASLGGPSPPGSSGPSIYAQPGGTTAAAVAQQRMVQGALHSFFAQHQQQQQQQQQAALLSYQTAGNPINNAAALMGYSATATSGGEVNSNSILGGGGRSVRLQPSLLAAASQRLLAHSNKEAGGNENATKQSPSKKFRGLDTQTEAINTDERKRMERTEDCHKAKKESDTKSAKKKRRISPSDEEEEEVNNVPERPSCAYDIYLKHELSLALASKPDMCKSSGAEASSSPEIETMTKEIEARWRKASPNTVKKFWKLADKDMDRFRVEMTQYHQKEAVKWRSQVSDRSLLDC